MGGVVVADGAWNGWQVLLFLLLCISFAAFAAMYVAVKLSDRGKVFAARWGQYIVLALAVSVIAFMAGLLLPQYLAPAG